MGHDKTPAWFALLHNESHRVASRLGSLFSGEGAGIRNYSSQTTTRCDLLCNNYADMFETPSRIPGCKIKDRIGLINENAQTSKLQQYYMSSGELVEV